MRINGRPSWRRTPPCGRRLVGSVFADEAHFRADAELRGGGCRAILVNSSSRGMARPATIRRCVWRRERWNGWTWRSAAFLDQLRQRHSGPLQVIWDNAPAHRGEAVREYLRRPGLGLRLVNLPGYSPDFNADEAIWGWAREEATGNLCLGSRAAVQERVGSFLARLTSRKDEVKRRCARSAAPDSQPGPRPANAHPTLALV